AFRLELGEDLGGAVGGRVVDDEHLLRDRGRRDLLEDEVDGAALVVHGHEHRQLDAGAVHRRSAAQLRDAGPGGGWGGHTLSRPYRPSLRYRVDGSMPRTSAVRDLLPPSLLRTQRM